MAMKDNLHSVQKDKVTHGEFQITQEDVNKRKKEVYVGFRPDYIAVVIAGINKNDFGITGNMQVYGVDKVHPNRLYKSNGYLDLPVSGGNSANIIEITDTGFSVMCTATNVYFRWMACKEED